MYFNEDEDYITINLEENSNTIMDINKIYFNKLFNKLFNLLKSKKENIYLLTIFIILYFGYIFYFISYI